MKETQNPLCIYKSLAIMPTGTNSGSHLCWLEASGHRTRISFQFSRFHKEIKSLLAYVWIKLEAELALTQSLSSCLVHGHDLISSPKLYRNRQPAHEPQFANLTFFKCCLEIWFILINKFLASP